MQALVVAVAGQRCGLPLSEIREIVRAVRLTPLPGAPACIEGVVDVRGEVLPVLDLRVRFDLAPRPIVPADFLVIATAGPRLVALRADDVLGLVDLDPGALDALPHVAVRGRSVAGAARLPDGLVLIHDPALFLSEVEAQAVAAALETRAPSGNAP